MIFPMEIRGERPRQQRQQPGKPAEKCCGQPYIWPKILYLVAIPLLLAGCTGDLLREPLSQKPRVAKLEALNMPKKIVGMESDGEDAADDIILTRGRPVLVASPLDSSDPLPPYRVPWMSFVDAPLQDVMQTIMAGARVPLAIVWDNPLVKISRSSVSMTNLSGDLTTVLNKLAESYGFYWRHKDGMLHIAADRQYITPVPPIADLFESLPIMVKTLGGTDVFLDKSARMITFRAGSQSFHKITSYLDILRENRSLIVYDTYIWEVVLNDSSKMGIDWGALAGAIPATALTTGPAAALPAATGLGTVGLVNAVSGGTGLSLSFAGSRLSIDTLIEFLRSQGNINSLSQPKIQLLSGGRATLKDEIATTYVSRVGNPTISGTAVIAGSVETSQVKTGVTLEVAGDVSDGTIYSDIAIRVSDLMAMGSAIVNGSTISLPQTSSREVNTHVRAKPGDTILLAGIQYDKLNNTVNTGMGVLRSAQSAVQRSELVIVMKPRIKYFVAKGSEAKARSSSSPDVSVPPAAPPAREIARPVTAPVVTVVPSVTIAPIVMDPPVLPSGKRSAVVNAPGATRGADNDQEIWRMKEEALRQEAMEAEGGQGNALNKASSPVRKPLPGAYSP